MRHYVLVILKTGPTPMPAGEERKEMFRGYFANMTRLAAEGKLALAGPLDGVDGWRGQGEIVSRALARGRVSKWFESLRSMAEALSPDNQELLRLIDEKNPQSLAELEQISGRRKSNLSRTLKMLEGYGIVSISRKRHRLIPKVHATDFKVEFGVNLGGFPKKG